jgi:hypothetical protein
MTRAGLEFLCSGFTRIHAGVQPHQAPSFTLRWILNSWAGKLPARQKAAFLQTTVQEILDEYGQDVFSQRWLNSFSSRDTEELACGVYFHGRKREADATYANYNPSRSARFQGKRLWGSAAQFARNTYQSLRGRAA